METLLTSGYRQEEKADRLQSDIDHQIIQLDPPPSTNNQRSITTNDALSLKSTKFVLPKKITLATANTRATSPGENAPLIFMAKFNVQFKAEIHKTTIDEFILNNNARIISKSKWAPNTFVLAVIQNQEIDTLSVATEFYDSGLTNFITGLVQ